jgi:predicted RNase H-like HicB family nuclease
MKQTACVEARIPVLIFQEGRKVVAYSPAIDLSTFGNTEAQARKRFAEAAEMFFEEIAEMGTLENVLLECGWRKASKKSQWSPPVFKGCSEEPVLIPAGGC